MTNKNPIQAKVGSGLTDWWYKPYGPYNPDWWYKPYAPVLPLDPLDISITTTGDLRMFNKDWSYTSSPTTYTYTVDLPGHTDIEVTQLTEDTIKVTATRNGVAKEHQFHLPSDASFGSGEATFKNGVLTVTLPRIKVLPKKLVVKQE